jgi:hypothetical protein
MINSLFLLEFGDELAEIEELDKLEGFNELDVFNLDDPVGSVAFSGLSAVTVMFASILKKKKLKEI